MTLTIPDTIARQVGLNEPSALKELALTLFSQGRLSGSQARCVAGVNFFVFEEWLKERGLGVHEFTEKDLGMDVQTLRSGGLL